MDYWLNSNHPLMEKPGVIQRDSEGRIRQIWKYSFVRSALEINGKYERVWWGTKAFWVETKYLEEVKEMSGGVVIPETMASRRMEKQYIFVDGKQKFNQCGEFSVMWCAGVGPDVFYPTLKANPKLSGLYRTHVTYDGLTSPYSLAVFAAEFGVKYVYDHDALWTLSPRIVNDYMHGNGMALLAGVDIDTLGRVWSPSSGLRKIAHWIVVSDINDYADRIGDGLCTAYNSFRNGVQYDVRFTDIRPAMFMEVK